MESIKEKLPIILASLMFVALCVWAYFVVFVQTSNLYTQIDNEYSKNLSNDEYEYSLRAYDEHGKMQDVTFKANKILREDAYLRLETMSIRGVVNWEEVSFDELPADVQFRYNNTN